MFAIASLLSSSATGWAFFGSSDGGETWNGREFISGIPPSFLGAGAPVIDRQGNIYVYGRPPNGGGGVIISTNLGVSWSLVHQINTGTISELRGCVDNNTASPYAGRQYAFWGDWSLAWPLMTVSHSTDNSLTWTTPVTILPAVPGHYQQGVDGACGANGDAYVCWGNPQSGNPFVSEFVGFARSTDGGVTWSGNTSMYACYGIRGILSGKGIRVDDFPRVGVDKSGGLRSGWIYIVTPEKNLAPAGNDPDIILHRSTDRGTTWSAGIRVNQDALNNGKNQYFPSIAVDDSGWVNVLYYDDRNTPSDSAEVYLSRSKDGGLTWNDRVVSDHRFKPTAIPGTPSGYSGEYTSITAGGGSIHPFWTDDVTGTSQAWTTAIPLVTRVGHPDPPSAYSFELNQNYPNPFNPRTEIRFRIAEYGWTRLKVFDMLGREVATLVNELKQPGTYMVPWNTSGTATGVYVYRLQAGNFAQQRRMLLVK